MGGRNMNPVAELNESSYGWSLVYSERDREGHSLWRCEDGRLAIADLSGGTPSQTFDRVLWVDRSRLPKIMKSGNGSVILPLIHEISGNSTGTATTMTFALACGFTRFLVHGVEMEVKVVPAQE
jgi:hypothetical protein